MKFFRVQTKGFSFDEMRSHNSESGGDGGTEGLAVCDSPASNGGFGGALAAMNPDDEFIVLEGVVVEKIYDGYRIRPTREIARYTIREYYQMVENDTIWDLED